MEGEFGPSLSLLDLDRVPERGFLGPETAAAGIRGLEAKWTKWVVF